MLHKWMRTVAHMKVMKAHTRETSHATLHELSYVRRNTKCHMWGESHTCDEECGTYESHESPHTWNEPCRHKSSINKSSVNPKSTSNQSSKPCTVLQYPSRTASIPRSNEPSVWNEPYEMSHMKWRISHNEPWVSIEPYEMSQICYMKSEMSHMKWEMSHI